MFYIDKNQIQTSLTTFCTHVMITLMNHHSDTHHVMLPAAHGGGDFRSLTMEHEVMITPSCFVRDALKFMCNDGLPLNANDHISLRSKCPLVAKPSIKPSACNSFVLCLIGSKLHV